MSEKPFLSVVTPAYNEADNLPLLYEQLCETLGDLGWEWLVVDDHSTDTTFRVVAEIVGRDGRVRVIRLARNAGSHTAIVCGLDHALGDCAAILAADLQDPPDVILQLLTKWRDGAQVVWAMRTQRKGEKAINGGFGRLYYFLMRRIVGMQEMPATGADFFLLDRRVIETLRQFSEKNVSILALITWIGFRQETISYAKRARLHGHSGWSLEKKLKLVADSVTSFSYVPIRLMSLVGFIIAFIGFAYSGVVIFNGMRGLPPEGWASLMVTVLVIGGIQMLMMGVLGEYLWRALDESRRRPRYWVEAVLPTVEKKEAEWVNQNQVRS